MKISESAVDRPYIVLLSAGLLFALGLHALSSLPLESDPAVKVPWVWVAVPYPGAAPEDVEDEITRELDEALHGLEDVDYVSSVATQGASFHYIKFLDGIDGKEAVADVRGKVDEIKSEFPDDAEEPRSDGISFDDKPILILSLTGDRDRFRLKEIAEDLKPRLENIPGVRATDIFGGLEREIRVEVDTDRMAGYGVTFEEVSRALKSQNVNFPGGRFDVDSHSYLVRTIGRFEDPAEVGDTVVRVVDGAPLYLRDIAEIQDTHKEVKSYAFYNGEPAVSLVIQPEPRINTLETVRLVREEVERLRTTLPLGVQARFSTDRSVQIRDKTRQLTSSAVQGLVLVVGILLLAMGFRNALLVVVAIPGSLLFAFLMLKLFGMEIANITLFSFVLAIGMVVDGAIIVGENIYRHVEEGFPPDQAAKVGIREVGTAVIAADLTTVGAFLPMLMMTGIMGQYMSVLPKVMAFSLLGSILMDHFLIPVLAARFMRVPKRRDQEREGWLLGRFRAAYTPLLNRALSHRSVVLVLSAAAFAAAIAVVAAGLIGFEFFPKVDIGRFNINYRLPMGARIEETTALGEHFFAAFSDIPEIDNYVLTTGDTGALSPDGREGRERGPTVGRVTVELVPAAARERSQAEVVRELERRIGEYPGVEVNFFQLREGPPVGAAVAVRIQGDDLETLTALARNVEGTLRGIPGATDVRTDLRLGKPEVRVRIDRDRARTVHGVTSADVSRALFAAFQGEETTEVFFGDEKVDIRLTSANRG
ncbi:MAG: efflux RND transporter permease subunit, partial [Myxococcales bacterium]|nr:efflux RND transporter permease subunit [Myxococcales bacterium]